jgi:hypothetical protein
LAADTSSTAASHQQIDFGDFLFDCVTPNIPTKKKNVRVRRFRSLWNPTFFCLPTYKDGGPSLGYLVSTNKFDAIKEDMHNQTKEPDPKGVKKV